MSLVVITNLFPNPREPQRSTFNERQLLALHASEPLEVVCPVSWVQKLRYARRGELATIESCRIWRGIPVRYPTYVYVPRFLAWTRGVTMALSISRASVAAARGARPRAILATWAFPDGFAAVLLGRLLRLPVVIKVHGSDVESLRERGWRTRLALWGLRRAARVVSVSRYLRDRLVEHGIAPGAIDVVHNGVDAETFRPGDAGEARRALGLDGARRLVLYVGNLKEDKGLLDLIHPAVIEACRAANAGVAIIGGGPLRARLEKEIRERALEADVRLLGTMPPAQIATWMNAADCLCLPSHHEGIPNVILEALSCGLPVLATRVGGIPEVVAEGAGVLVEAERPEALAAGVRAIFARAWQRPAVRATSPAGSWTQSAAARGAAIDAAGA